MSVPNRRIGQPSSTEELLLHDILKQIERLIQVTSNGGGGGSGTVTSVSVTSANGFAGTVATATTTPAITISTTITGLLKGNGTAISAAVAGTDYLAPNGSGAALTGVYLLASGGTLTGANTITGTTTNILKYIFNNLAVTAVDGAGAWFANTTAAAAGAQQISPSLVFEGQGWKTNATAESQSVKWRMDVLPTQGSANPTAGLRFSQSINGSAYVNYVTIQDNGVTFTQSSALLNFLGSGSVLQHASGGAFTFRSSNQTNAVPNGLWRFTTNGTIHTSGTISLLFIDMGYAPTSGTGILNGYLINGTINQTGGANGLITYFNIAPVITAAVNVTGYDWNPTTPSNISGTHLAARFVTGAVLLGDTAKTANTGDKVLIMSNAGTNATAAQTNGIVLHSKDSSDGSANATLALYTEQAPEATATFTQTHRIKVWWNNVEYWLSLDAV